MVFYVDDIKLAATEEVTKVVVSTLNEKFPNRRLGEVEWCMGCDTGGTGIKVVRIFRRASSLGGTKSFLTCRSPAPSPVPLPWDLRHVSEEETLVDVPSRKMVGSLMWIAK